MYNTLHKTRRFATIRTIFAMMVREMITTFGRSPGGYIWAIVEPVAAIGLLSVVFSLAFRAPSLGTTFVLFYASAYLPFMLFMDVTGKVASAIRFSRPLMTYPVITFVDVIIARFLLNVVTHLVVMVIVIAGVFAFYELPLDFDLVHIANAIGMASVLALGVGTVNCYLSTAFPVYERFWQVATRPLIIVSGLFFVFESVPTAFRDYLWWNPLYHITGEMRSGLYATYDATYVSPSFVYLIGFSTLALGLLILDRTYRDLINI